MPVKLGSIFIILLIPSLFFPASSVFSAKNEISVSLEVPDGLLTVSPKNNFFHISNDRGRSVIIASDEWESNPAGYQLTKTKDQSDIPYSSDYKYIIVSSL